MIGALWIVMSTHVPTVVPRVVRSVYVKAMSTLPVCRIKATQRNGYRCIRVAILKQVL